MLVYFDLVDLVLFGYNYIIRRVNEPKLTSLLSPPCRNSPLSMLIAHRQLQRGLSMTARQCFEMEYRLAARMCRGPSDFVEGVTCRLIQRGATPQWLHSSIHDVRDAEVEAYFAPLDFCAEITPRLDTIDAYLSKARLRL